MSQMHFLYTNGPFDPRNPDCHDTLHCYDIVKTARIFSTLIGEELEETLLGNVNLPRNILVGDCIFLMKSGTISEITSIETLASGSRAIWIKVQEKINPYTEDPLFIEFDKGRAFAEKAIEVIKKSHVIVYKNAFILNIQIDDDNQILVFDGVDRTSGERTRILLHFPALSVDYWNNIADMRVYDEARKVYYLTSE